MRSTAGFLVRLARSAAPRPLSQRQLARRSGVAQPNIAAIESSAGRDATVETLDRLVGAAGSRLTVLPTRAETVAEVAAKISRHLAAGQPERAYRAVLGLHDSLERAEAALRVALTVMPPERVGDQRWDALVAAVVEHHLDGLLVPSWVRDPQRVADGWFVDDVPELAARTRRHTPSAFKRHGVWIDRAELASV